MNSIVASDDWERRSGKEERVQSPGCGMSASTTEQRFVVEDGLSLLHVEEFNQANDCRYLTVIYSSPDVILRLFPIFAIRSAYG